LAHMPQTFFRELKMFKPGDLAKIRCNSHLWKNISPSGYPSYDKIVIASPGDIVIITESSNTNYILALHPEYGIRWIYKAGLDILEGV
jgi:hypothetical protein